MKQLGNLIASLHTYATDLTCLSDIFMGRMNYDSKAVHNLSFDTCQATPVLRFGNIEMHQIFRQGMEAEQTNTAY